MTTVNLSDTPPATVGHPVAERANTLTHGLGTLLSIAGAVVLLSVATAEGGFWRILGCGIFAGSMVAVYTASTLSHGITTPRLRRRLRILDQGFIYLLIAGTYTPFALAYQRTPGWWAFLGLVWAIALIGFCSKVLFTHRIEAVAIWSYVLLGWLPLLAAPSLMNSVPSVALWWMLLGGLCYMLGTVFLVYDHKHLHFHAVWHLFVIAGSTWHFFAILCFVASVPHSGG